MRKTFKGVTNKIFSIALILCMVIAMFPATLASATEIGESVTYDFNPNLTEGQNIAELTGAYETYGWEFAASANDSYTAKAQTTTTKDYMLVSSSSKSSRPQGVWYALKIKAPESGVYNAVLGHSKLVYTSNETQPILGDLYLIPASEIVGTDIRTAIADKMAKSASDTDPYKIYDDISYGQASGNTWDATTPLKDATNDEFIDITIDDSEQSYYLVFRKPIEQTAGIADGKYTDGTQAYQAPNYLTLTKTADIVKKYTFTYDFNQGWDEGASLTEKNYGDTKQSWIFADKSHEEISATSSSTTRDYMAITSSGKTGRKPGMWAALKLKTPVAGEYTATLIHGQVKDSSAVGDVYWIPVNAVLNGIEDILNQTGTDELYKKKDSVAYGLAGGNDWKAKTELGTFMVEEGVTEHYIVFRIPVETPEESIDSSVCQMYPASLTLTAGTSLAYMGANMTLSSEITTVGDAAAIGANAYLSDGSSAEVTVGNITSSNNSVIKVVADGIVAVGAGTATVSADVTYDGAVVETITKTVTVENKETDNTLSYAYSIDGTENVVSDIVRGTDVTVSAPEIANKVFTCWLMGKGEGGRWLSDKADYTFPLTTNTYLTAVYRDETTDTVEFFNADKEFVASKAVTNGSVEGPAAPSLLGYSFDNWYVDENTTLSEATLGALTRAVAKYNKDTSVSYTVTVGSDNIKEGTADYNYDDSVTLTSESGSVYWFRDGKCVDYGESYTFNVWGNTTVTTSDVGTTGAKLMLDSVVKTGNAYMIEYDNGGKNIVEVGILFGTGTDKTALVVDSCMYKAASQNIQPHGQLTARPNSTETLARGYLVYEENDEYKVIYAN